MKCTDEHKRFIVTRLAMFDTPKAVVVAFREPFGVDIDRRQVGNYDPQNLSRHLSPKLRILFDEMREKFVEDVASIPIAQRSFRLRRLQAMHDAMMDKGNYIAAADMLEQAAKEAGDVFTNSLKVGGRVKHQHHGEVSFKAEEQRATLADIIEQALDATKSKGKTEH